MVQPFSRFFTQRITGSSLREIERGLEPPHPVDPHEPIDEAAVVIDDFAVDDQLRALNAGYESTRRALIDEQRLELHRSDLAGDLCDAAQKRLVVRAFAVVAA